MNRCLGARGLVTICLAVLCCGVGAPRLDAQQGTLPDEAQAEKYRGLRARARYLVQEGRVAEAVVAAEEMVKFAEGLFGRLDSRTAKAKLFLAQVYVEQQELAKAESFAKDALTILEQEVSPATISNRLAADEILQQEATALEAEQKDALRTLMQRSDWTWPQLVEATGITPRDLALMIRYDPALKSLHRQRVRALVQTHQGNQSAVARALEMSPEVVAWWVVEESNEVSVVRALRVLTQIYAGRGDTARATQMQERADEIGPIGDERLDDRWRVFKETLESQDHGESQGPS